MQQKKGWGMWGKLRLLQLIRFSQRTKLPRTQKLIVQVCSESSITTSKLAIKIFAQGGYWVYTHTQYWVKNSEIKRISRV